jgi:hypothetical protein
MEINPKFTFFVCIILIVIGLIGFVEYNKNLAKIEQEKILEQQKLEAHNQELQNMVIVSTPEPEPTGTPYQMYVPNPYKLGSSLKLNEWYNFKEDNALGLKDMNISTTMYGYKTLKNFTYYDYNWGQVFNESAPDGYVYFLAYINTVMDNTITGDDTRMYLPQQNSYALFIGDTVYYPIVFDYIHNQILEMDNTYNLNHVERIKPYAYEYVNTKDNRTGIKVPTMLNKYTLYGGISNAEDGYIIFQIPENYNYRMIRVEGNFFSFGSMSWRISD